MPDQFDTIRSQLNADRQARAGADAQLVANAARLAALQRDQAALSRAGADQDALAATRAELDALQAARGQLLQDRRAIDTQLNDRLGDFIRPRSPADLLKTLDASVPLALLPVRLETRFFDSARELRIRVFPDQIHVDSHIPELTATEADLGRWYWGQRLRADTATADAAWAELSRRLGARAGWVAQRLTPTNYDPALGSTPGDVDPVFPEVTLRPSGGRAPQATILPDRWVAVGLRRSGAHSYAPVFTVWGGAVPDALSVGPSFEQLADAAPAADEPAIDPDLRWLTDYEAARAAGMAITVRDTDLTSGRLADGLDLLLVFGVDWTLDANQSADAIDRLLQAHQFADGLAFVPQGTATNTTGTTSSGLSSDPAASTPDPTRAPAIDPDWSAAARMSRGLGLPDTSTLGRIAGAGLTEQRTTSWLVDALWESTLGYYLDELLDPFATDTLIALARDHAVTHLQPFGPYATLRVGKQPYGLLPTVALTPFKPDRPQGIESGLQRLLGILGWYWREGLDDVPRMGKSGDPDDDLLALLQQTPVSTSARYRRVLDLETVQSSDGLGRLAAVQSNILRALVLPQLASYAGPNFHAAKILDVAVYPTDRPLTAPFTQPGPLAPDTPLAKPYIAQVAAQTRAGNAGRAALQQQSRAGYALLEQLLALAALRELDRHGTKLLDAFLLNRGAITQLPNKSSLSTSATIGVYRQPEADTPGKVLIETPQQLAGAVIKDLTGSVSVAEYIGAQLRLPQGPERPELRTLAQFLTRLDALAGLSAGNLDRSFRAILDCYAHRLDAWFTSLASRRAADLRAKKPTGLHLGGYGWVENLRPDTQPDSLGFVHAPSLNHAATAALLRSGHLSHRGAEGAALNIDLSSRRVRNAMTLIEGVQQGQPLAALLGYRFERGLRDRGLTLMRFVLPFRLLAPLRSTAPDSGSEPQESIAARDVVDGVALAERWRSGEELIGQLATTAPTAAERAGLQDALADLSDALDAVSDVLTAETVFQTVQGNYERAGAALAALDRQARPPDPQVVQTPRSGTRYTQRVALILQSSAPPAAWQPLMDLRASVEPRLNAWLAAVLGDPARYTLAAEVRQGDAVVTTVSASLADLGLSPLSLVLSCVSSHARRPSTFEMLLAEQLAGQVPDPAPEQELVLLEAPPLAAGPDAIGLGALRSLLRLLNTLIARRRALDARDLYPPEGEPPPGVDLDDLTERRDLVLRPALDAVITGLTNALAAPNGPNLRAALRAAAALGAPDALPDTLLDDPEALAALGDQAAQTLATLQRTSKALADLIASFTPPATTDPTYQIRPLEHLTACVRLVLGEAFPLLPRFTPGNAAELAATLADQPALLDGDPFAPLTWLQQLATVRPDTDALASVLTASDLLGGPPASARVLQLPHAAGQRWAGLTLPSTSPLLSLMTVGDYQFDAPLAGLVVDGWSELIPAAKEMTGVTFHYDAPAARAPQTILLAQPPDLGQPTWSLETLLQTLLETWDLARLRAVGPKEIRALGGGMLPALYLPQDKSVQVPAVDFDRLSATYSPALSGVLGKVLHDN